MKMFIFTLPQFQLIFFYQFFQHKIWIAVVIIIFVITILVEVIEYKYNWENWNTEKSFASLLKIYGIFCQQGLSGMHFTFFFFFFN